MTVTLQEQWNELIIFVCHNGPLVSRVIFQYRGQWRIELVCNISHVLEHD